VVEQEKILVTGGGGMLATAFRKLIPRAHFADKAAFDLTAGDGRAAQLFTELNPALAINCAAYTKVDLAEKNEELATEVNGHAVAALVDLCNRTGAKLLHFSTDYVFDGTRRRPLRPDDPTGPQSAYGRSKLVGEQMIQKNARAPWLILRTAWLYGFGGPNFVQTMVNAARAGKPLTVVSDQVGSPTYTMDLAQATLDLIARDATGILHVTNSGQTTWF